MEARQIGRQTSSTTKLKQMRFFGHCPLNDNIAINKNFSAFTLAEVLITLGIIGVVAAITIPTLLSNSQNKEYKVAFKKVYSELSQAYTMIINDYGFDYTGIGFTQNGPTSRDLFCEKLKCITTCNTLTADCWDNFSNIQQLGGGTVGILVHDTSVAVLASGARVSFRDDRPLCDYNNFMSTPDVCSELIIDVNGEKGPNTMGKDVYISFITKNKFVPAGAFTTKTKLNTACSSTQNASPDSSYQATWVNLDSNTGSTCAVKVLSNVDY